MSRKLPPWIEPQTPPFEVRSIYLDGRTRGRRAQLVARIDGGRRWRVRWLHPRPGERRERIVSPLTFARPEPDPTPTSRSIG